MPRPWRPTPHNQICARTTLSLLNWSETNISQETSNLPLRNQRGAVPVEAARPVLAPS
jgi:hypothetical protein